MSAPTFFARGRSVRGRTRPGMLSARMPDVAARLRAEGVPAMEVSVVGVEVERCVRFIGQRGGDTLSITLHPWTDELIARYGDKLCTLLMTTRGKVDADETCSPAVHRLRWHLRLRTLRADAPQAVRRNA